MFEKVNEILDFWLSDSSRWWQEDQNFDATIRDRFLELHRAAQALSLQEWCQSPKSCLAYIILMDQFPRNMFRGTADAYASDNLALAAALDGIDNKFDKELGFIERIFFYMPLEHSEQLIHQQQSVALFKKLLEEAKAFSSPFVDMLKENYEYAIKHHEVIKRFGRFPHRNAILNRTSLKAEKIYLEEFPRGF